VARSHPAHHDEQFDFFKHSVTLVAHFKTHFVRFVDCSALAEKLAAFRHLPRPACRSQRHHARVGDCSNQKRMSKAGGRGSGELGEREFFASISLTKL
jgi:hypothetical protein